MKRIHPVLQRLILKFTLVVAQILLIHNACAALKTGSYLLEAGHPSLQGWQLPDAPPAPPDNQPTIERIALGKQLFFDPRLSRDGNLSCASCHNPVLGWADGLPTARGAEGKALARSTPTVINAAHNTIQMWDGRKATLEDQALAPIEATVEMNQDIDQLLAWLNRNKGYRESFAKAYPGEKIGKETLAKAIASFERSIVSNNSPFDRWLRGDASAMDSTQVRGFWVFLDLDKGNCVACHQAPNFTDNGFHNIGLASFARPEPDMGRFVQRPVKLMQGAFKTPVLRNVALTAPYFHDGSARSLEEVIEVYRQGGVIKTNLSPNIRPLKLSARDKKDLVAFMRALTGEVAPITLPILPPD
jgi:cytochrome c peroxidase